MTELQTHRDTMAKENRLLDTKIVRLNQSGLNVRYAELGDPTNPPVILLHGVPENLQGWYAVAPLLAEQYRVLALDWPGFGGSDSLPSPADYTSRRFAEVIVDFMDSLHIRQASLVATDIALVPEELLMHAPEGHQPPFASAEANRDAYFRYLSKRLHGPRAFLDEAVRAKQALGEPTQPLPYRR